MSGIGYMIEHARVNFDLSERPTYDPIILSRRSLDVLIAAATIGASVFVEKGLAEREAQIMDAIAEATLAKAKAGPPMRPVAASASLSKEQGQFRGGESSPEV